MHKPTCDPRSRDLCPSLSHRQGSPQPHKPQTPQIAGTSTGGIGARWCSSQASKRAIWPALLAFPRISSCSAAARDLPSPTNRTEPNRLPRSRGRSVDGGMGAGRSSGPHATELLRISRRGERGALHSRQTANEGAHTDSTNYPAKPLGLPRSRRRRGLVAVGRNGCGFRGSDPPSPGRPSPQCAPRRERRPLGRGVAPTQSAQRFKRRRGSSSSGPAAAAAALPRARALSLSLSLSLSLGR